MAPGGATCWFAGGKSGVLYLLDRDNLGGFQQARPNRACPKGADSAKGTLGPDDQLWGPSTVWPGDGGWLIAETQGPSGRNGNSVGTLSFYGGGLGTFALRGQTASEWHAGSGVPIVTSVGQRNGSALVWGVSRAASGRGTLRVLTANVAPGAREPAELATYPVGGYAKFTAPGVGPDGIYIGNGARQVLAFGPIHGGKPTAALLSHAALRPTRLRAGKAGGLLGTTGPDRLTYTLSRRSQMLVGVFTRSSRGTKVLATQTIADARGANAIALLPRAHNRALPAGHYELGLTPLNQAGVPDALTQTVAFTLVG